MNEPILCYVDGKFAFFTTQSLEDQKGDDWNDRPWHSNAGDPYFPREGDNWQIVQIAFDADARTLGSGSVDDINAGHCPG